jgi:hypothetical protein
MSNPINEEIGIEEIEEIKDVQSPVATTLVVFRQVATHAYKELPLYTLVTFNATMMILTAIWDILSRVTKNVVKSIKTDTYVFFDKNYTPYHTSDFKTTGPGIAPIAWHYSSDSLTFSTPNLDEVGIVLHPLPFLAAQIKYGDLILYDITEFVGKIKCFSQRHDTPSPELIVAAWSLESGIVVSQTGLIQLSIITDEGDSKNIPLYKPTAM